MSKITDEQVEIVLRNWFTPVKEQNIQPNMIAMRKALEAAFPTDQHRHSIKNTNILFITPFVVTEEMREEFSVAIGDSNMETINGRINDALQSFVDRHAIKPIAFADQIPTEGINIYFWDLRFKCWKFECQFVSEESYGGRSHWLPASDLPIPEPAVVDPKEAAWNRYCDDCNDPYSNQTDECAFKAGYEAGQAGGKK
jgi:hypothetical protein